MKKKVFFLSLNAFKRIIKSSNLQITRHDTKNTLFVIDKDSELTYRCQQNLDPNLDMAWLIPIEECGGDRDKAIQNACLVNVERNGEGSNITAIGTV
jgi:hypothetical protein